MNNLNDFRYPEWGEQFPGMIPTDDIVKSAKESGGIGWIEDSQVLGTVVIPNGESSTSITPAILRLVDGEEYSLLVTIDGLTKELTATATTSHGDVVLYGNGSLESLIISYTARVDTNVIDITHNTDHDLPITIATASVSHKINSQFLPESGADIPTPTVVDEGKVLTVDSEGSPAWAQPSGGGTFIVTFTANNDVYSADKTYAEIDAAATGGKVIVFMYQTLTGIALKTTVNSTDGYVGTGFATDAAPGVSLSQLMTFTGVITQDNQVLGNYDHVTLS